MPESEADARTLTLEAYADTIVPGEKRFPGDRSVAGAAPGPGSVAAGAIELMETDATGITAGLDYLAQALNEQAAAYAEEHGLTPDDDVPAFVALAYEDRAALVQKLVAWDNPERDGWVLLTMFANMAFDSASHKPLTEALAEGHPGLKAMGVTDPDEDGLWRFPHYSYRRPLATVHPDTLPNGSLG